MNNEKKLLKISGILKCITGALLIQVPVYGIIVLLCGIFLYLQSFEDDEVIYKNRILYMIVCFISIVDLIGSVIYFITYDKIKKYKNSINAPPKVFYRKNREKTKIDLLLKLGVLMVFISGLLFATTSWSFIADILKVVSLFIFGIVFFVLAIFSEEKLKLYKSAYLYWMLGIAFLLFTIISIVYFKLFGISISFMDDTASLSYAVVFLTLSGFLVISYFKYPKKYLLLFSIISLFISLYNICSYFIISKIFVICILSVVLLLINILNKKDGLLKIFGNIFSYILFGLILIFYQDAGDIEYVIACTINMINLIFIVFKNDNREHAIINVVLTYILIGVAFIDNSYFEDYSALLIGLYSTLYTLIINSKLLDLSKLYRLINYIIYTLVVGLIIVFEFETIHSIVISSIYLLLGLIYSFGLFGIEDKGIYKKFETTAIFYFVISIIGNLSLFFYEEFQYAVLFTSIIYSIIHLIIYLVKKEINVLYVISLLVINIFGIISNNSSLLIGIVIILTSLYLFFITYKDSDKTKIKINNCVSLVLLLTSIYVPFVLKNILDINIYFACCSFIVLLLISIFIFRNKLITGCILIYMALPLIKLTSLSSDYVWNNIFITSVNLYLLFLINYFFIKSNKVRNIFGSIGIIVLLLRLFSINTIATAVYIGIIGIIIVIIGYRSEELFLLFKTGIVVIIVDIILSLTTVWMKIPFWLYLLVFGLAIIIFVMYKEYSNQKKSK